MAWSRSNGSRVNCSLGLMRLVITSDTAQWKALDIDVYSLFPHLLDFSGKDGLWRSGAVDTIGLD
jgi:hypothetical protein